MESIQLFDITAWCPQKFKKLSDLLIEQEGTSTSVYECTKKKKTIGHGHNLDRGSSSNSAFDFIEVDRDDILNGAELPKHKWFELLLYDIYYHYNDLKKIIPDIEKYPACVQIALWSFIFWIENIK